MKSSTPKLLHKVAGLPIIGHVLNASNNVGRNELGVITNPDNNLLSDFISSHVPNAQIFIQNERKGTAHAAQMAKPLWEKAKGYV
ncbi:MAG: bifunctional UDP-N-acetylglucosamine diphosphorylase/glucosamine-1-phosphate N-acetyltransferase GlmU, partial [Devosiaceae bacterium]|nr:bifunctional UDP-N-acetylglucosamine diphosphorylase/glucosamine-1-phosphate N-acetyltransferase GlmU [Devosiaceae bacterium]